MTRVLITGAAGAIGRTLHAGLAGRYPLLRLADVREIAAIGAEQQPVRADLADFDAMLRVTDGIDCIVHLAGVPREGAWDVILPNNIIGTYNLFEAARLNRVRRVVFASSNHAVGFHPVSRRLDPDSLPRPDTRYGVSKIFGEALGRLYADKHGLSVACLRIGSFRERPEDERQLSTWISPRDMVELARCCIEAPEYHFLMLYGVSANTRSRWDNGDAALIGFCALDDAEAYAADVNREPAGDVAARFHGGGFCALEFSGDPDAIV